MNTTSTEFLSIPLGNLHPTPLPYESVTPTPSSSSPLLRAIPPGHSTDHISERETQTEHTYPLRQRVPQESTFFGNVKQLWTKLFFLFLMTCFTAFLCYYFFSILVSQYPKVGALDFSPSDINFIVGVLSQTYAQMIQAFYSDIFEIIRWLQASAADGIFMQTFLQLGSSTGWLGSLLLFFSRGTHHIWTIQR